MNFNKMTAMFTKDKCMAFVVICVVLAFTLMAYAMNCLAVDQKCTADSIKGLSLSSMSFFTIAAILAVVCLFIK